MSAEETQQVTAESGGASNEKTSDFYKTSGVPDRFENPNWFKGYGSKPQHAMYRTTATAYGSKSPTVHTMPTIFKGRSQQFSQHLGTCGMYRNHSLNTAVDVSKV